VCLGTGQDFPATFKYYQSTLAAIHNDGDILITLDVLVKQVGILGIFSDWAATPTFYANCMDLK
jgi:glycerophosphoryl diester phosphodiesterase